MPYISGFKSTEIFLKQLLEFLETDILSTIQQRAISYILKFEYIQVTHNSDLGKMQTYFLVLIKLIV